MNRKKSKVDLNHADIDELITLPGVGVAMAERIIAARPFSSKTELRRVEGIGEVVYERLSTLISASPLKPEPSAVEPSLPETEITTDTIPSPAETIEMDVFPEELPVAIDLEATEQPELGEEEVAIKTALEDLALENEVMEEDFQIETIEPEEEISAREEETEPSEPETIEMIDSARVNGAPAEEPKPDYTPIIPTADQVIKPDAPAGLKRSEAYGIALFSGCASIIFAVLITLGLLSMLNGGINFARQDDIQNLRRVISGIETQASRLQNEMENLQTRLDNMEGLAGRISSIEKENNELQRQLEEVTTQADKIGVQIDALASQLREISARTDQFQSFLKGLRELLDGLSAQP